jgi:predicted N-acetyltransferase YhbS
LELREAYWGDARARAAFKRFVLRIHGVDFDAWDRAGFWDDAYRPCSYFQGDSVVASACVYLLDAVVDGRPTRLAQISGVGTLPGWRRQGLARELTEIGLERARDRYDGLFLFAAKGAVPFYERCGFEPLDEFLCWVSVEPVRRRVGAVRLDCDDPDQLRRIYRYASRRTPVSNRFGVTNAKLVMFHVLHGLRDRVVEIPDLGCLVLFDRRGDRVRLFDVVAERMPAFAELYPFIARTADRVVEFHFEPDLLEPVETQRQVLVGNHPFTRGVFPVEQPVFPYTSRA